LNRSQFYFYLKKVKDILSTAIPDVNGMRDGRRLAEKWAGLRQLEGERSSRMNTIENIGQRIIPAIRTESLAYSAASITFYHVSDHKL
jgi:hypothetical protein